MNLSDINLVGTELWKDLIGDRECHDQQGTMERTPYQAVWLTNRY